MKFKFAGPMIDSHAHLNEIQDIDSAIARAAAAGVCGIVAVGMDIDSNRTTLALAGRFPGMIHPAIGYHPWSITAESLEENVAFIDSNLTSCVALGEIGLDYKAKVKKKLQQEVFSRLLAIAADKDRPVIVHTRFSHERAHAMVREAGIQGAVFHWYTGSLELLDQIIEDGYCISATPALSYSPPHQEAMKRAPLEHILIETDSPVVYQGKVSEPAHLLITLNELSRIKGVSIERIAGATTKNAGRLFRL